MGRIATESSHHRPEISWTEDERKFAEGYDAIDWKSRRKEKDDTKRNPSSD